MKFIQICGNFKNYLSWLHYTRHSTGNVKENEEFYSG
jgi:hypothetical protein